jgi:hypothetical protein
MLCRIDANEEAALPACGDGHPAADQEGEPAEHPGLGELRLVGEQNPDAFRKRLVVCHGV